MDKEKNKWLLLAMAIALLFSSLLTTTQRILAVSDTPTVTIGELSNSVTTINRNGQLTTLTLAFIYADGEVVFCIDPKILVDQGRIYHSGTMRAGVVYDSSGYQLSEEQWETIQKIIFWGWDMSNDHSLTQYLKVQGAIYMTLGWEFDTLGHSITPDVVQNLISEVNAHASRTTSFNDETHTLKVGESITLTDTNNNLQYLEFTNQKGWQFTKNGNSLTISATEQAEDTTVSTRNLKLLGMAKTSLILESAGSQTLVAFKDPDRLIARLNLKIVKEGHLKIRKTDSLTGQVLSGVEFGLFEQGSTTPIRTGVTDEAGIVEFRDLEPKAFDIKETRTKETYRLNEQVYSVTVPAGDTLTVDVTNEPKMIQISVTKSLDKGLDGVATNTVGAGIRFDVIALSTNQVVDTLITDNNGQALSKKLPATDQYRLVEQVPTGYQSTEPITVTPETEDNKVYHYVVENKVKQSYLKIVKQDVETNEVIKVSGVTFQLFKDGQLVTQGDKNTFITDEKGEVNFSEPLVYGTYEIKEIQAPTGYVLSTEPLRVNITGDETTVTVQFKNTPQKGVIELFKKGQVLVGFQQDERGVHIPVFEEQLLGGAVFSFKNVATEETFTLTTTANEVLRTPELALGEYEITEVTVPNGYFNGLKPSERVVLTPQEQTVRLDVKPITLENERIRYGVAVNKVFEQLEHIQHEQEATIGLYTKEVYSEQGVTLPKDTLVGLKTVHSSDTFSVDLPYGMKVYAKELSTSAPYVLNEQLVEPTEGEAVPGRVFEKVTITNQLKRGNHELIKVDASSKEVLAGAVFRLVAITDGTNEKEIGTFTTNQAGRLVFTNLAFGKYFVQEVEALEGYFLNANKFFFDVTGEQQAVDSVVRIENERIPTIVTEATSINGGKLVYQHEQMKEVATFDNLIPGKEYTTIVTMYNEKGDVLGKQERTFIASGVTHTEIFFFDVPVGHYGDTVFGEELYRENEKVAIHFDLTNKQQTVKVLQPRINTLAQIGGQKEQYVGEKKELVDVLTYSDFSQGKVLVKTWLVKFGTDEVIGKPVEQVLELDQEGEVSVQLDKIDTSSLPAGKYTIMEQVFEVNEQNGKEETGQLLSEHTDNKDENQSFTIKERSTPTLPNTGENHTVVWIVVGLILLLSGCIVLNRQRLVNK